MSLSRSALSRAALACPAPARPALSRGALARPALMATACVVFLAGCHSGGKGDDANAKAPASARTAPASASAAPSSGGCPSRAAVAKALGLAAGDPKGIMSQREIVCQDGWVALPLRYPGTDPAWAVVRRENGGLSLVTEGTTELCADPKMKDAPAEIKKALGPYC